MEFYKLLYLHTFIIFLKVSRIKSCELPSICLHYRNCTYALNLMKLAGPTCINYCDRDDGIVCCPKLRKPTVSEKKCREFAKIKGFCPKDGLINKGVITRPHELPFIASVQLRDQGTNDWVWACGGSLIDPKFVLTAAHCFESLYTNVNKEIQVVLGAHNTSSGTALKAKLTRHEKYESDEYADIALLELDQEVNLTAKEIRPICLPSTDGNEVEDFGVAGWGKINAWEQAKVLMKSTLIHCLNANKDVPRTICASPKNNVSDVCQGDSGGPVFDGYPGRDDCLYALYGIVAQGNFCTAVGSQTNHTRVWHFREWIESKVWPNET